MPFDTLNRPAPYDMSAGSDTTLVRRDYMEKLRAGQLTEWHKEYLVEAWDAVRAIERKARADENYGLLKMVTPALVILRHLCGRYAPMTVEVDADCWVPGGSEDEKEADDKDE